MTRPLLLCDAVTVDTVGGPFTTYWTVAEVSVGVPSPAEVRNVLY